MKKLYLSSLLISLGVVLTLMCKLVPTKTNEIPLEVLFGDPVKIQYKISPDGNFISYVALGQTEETKNILNIWVKSCDQDDDKQITFDTKRPIRHYFWSYDSQTIFYVQDKKGDENWSLFSVNKDDIKEESNLTPFENIYVQIVEYTKNHPDKMLVALNKEDPSLHDVYLLDLSTKALTLLEKNNGTIEEWAGDKNLKVKAAINVLEDDRRELLIKNDQGAFESHFVWECDESPIALHYSSTGKLYFADYCDFSTNRLIEYDPVLKRRTILSGDTDFDIINVLWDKEKDTPLALCVDKLCYEWAVLDSAFANTYNNLRNLDKGNMSIVSHDNQRKKWIVCFDNDNAPVKYYLFDSGSSVATYLGTVRPELEKYNLVEMKPISFLSRDGLTIYGYLIESSAPQPAPLVLIVHGGPWARDSWGYNPQAQWLANRGYNVLQINFRGSKGFGKEFEQAGYREWGRKMHNDLLDGIEWLVKQGKADPKKVAIFGGSYGGYAALVGAAFTPDVFCCGIDIVGPSNLMTLLQSIPPYWKLYAKKFTRALGDVETEQDLLKERSPLFKADQIKIPLLIAQGAHDPRVKQAESEQIVEALKKHAIPHTYKLYEDEGHGFAHARNRLDFYAEVERFLKEHMPIS